MQPLKPPAAGSGMGEEVGGRSDADGLEAGVCKNRPGRISSLPGIHPRLAPTRVSTLAVSRPIWHILPTPQARSHPTQFRLKLNAVKPARTRRSGTKSILPHPPPLPSALAR